jgi:hypothetical protein
MSELKAMALVGVGAVLLSIPIDVVLLKMHASGEAFAVALVFISAIASVAMTLVIKHYEAVDQRRKREATLLR